MKIKNKNTLPKAYLPPPPIPPSSSCGYKAKASYQNPLRPGTLKEF